MGLVVHNGTELSLFAVRTTRRVLELERSFHESEHMGSTLVTTMLMMMVRSSSSRCRSDQTGLLQTFDSLRIHEARPAQMARRHSSSQIHSYRRRTVFHLGRSGRGSLDSESGDPSAMNRVGRRVTHQASNATPFIEQHCPQHNGCSISKP